jgi:2'-5' RNA ligase
LSANLANIAFDPFPVDLSGLGTFGGDDPRILYARVEPSEALANLARANETAARRAGLEPVSRKFTPHVTLARLQHPRIDPIARFLSRRGGFKTEPFLVTKFNLYSAKPLTGGGPYVIEQTFHSTLGTFDDSDWDDDVD